MNVDALIDTLAHNAGRIEALCANITPNQAKWSPEPAKWSTIEVMRHLLDEEMEDFRTRLDLTLHHPEKDWPPIDPEGWATARDYKSADLESTTAQFVARRAESVQWLRSLHTPDWSLQHVHPTAGAITAGNLLLSWVAHDQLHMRQLVRLQFQFAATLAPGSSSRYAGDW